MDVVSSGLLTRTKVCGRPSCAYATDPAARHDADFEFNRPRIQVLLTEWDEQTVKELLELGSE